MFCSLPLKLLLHLGTEFQSHNYGAIVSHTTIVFTRYIIPEWIRRNQNDHKTYGESFGEARVAVHDGKTQIISLKLRGSEPANQI